MAYEMVMPYHLHMPSYFLETFTEYPMKGLPFLRNNIYKDYHLMIFQALPLRILPAVSSQSDLQSKC